MSTEGFVKPAKKTVNTDDVMSDIAKHFGYPLPKEYENLFNLFTNMEKVVSVAYNRGLRITFESLSKNVMRNTKKSLNESHLAQIIGVYPNSYKLRWEKRRQTVANVSIGVSSGYDLVLSPHLQDVFCTVSNTNKTYCSGSLVSPVKLISPVKKRSERDFYLKSPSKASATPVPRRALVDSASKMYDKQLTNRKMLFRHFLVLRVIEVHNAFLVSAKLAVSPGELLHSEFDLESCPHLPCGNLPALPASKTPLRSAYDYFKAVPHKQQTPEAEEKKQKQMLKNDETPQKHQKSSLLERLRAKEKAKKNIDASKIAALQKRCKMLELLSKEMIEVICTHFTFLKVHSMSLHKLMPLVFPECEKMDKETFTEHIEVLCDAAGDLCKIETFYADKILKILEVRVDKIHHCVKKALEDGERELCLAQKA